MKMKKRRKLMDWLHLFCLLGITSAPLWLDLDAKVVDGYAMMAWPEGVLKIFAFMIAIILWGAHFPRWTGGNLVNLIRDVLSLILSSDSPDTRSQSDATIQPGPKR